MKWANTARAAYGAVKSGYNLYKRFKGDTKQVRRSYDGAGVTQQYDKSAQYTYKKMPYRKKAKYVRKVKNFKSLQLQQLACQIFIRNATLTGGAAAALQGATAIHLCGMNQSSETGGDDMLALCDRSAPEIGVDVPFSDPRKASTTNSSFIIDSAILDITFRNTGLNGLEVDVYHIMYHKDYENFPGLGSLLANGQIPDGNTSSVENITITNRGVTPFDFPLATKQGLKVLKKTKYFVPTGNTFTYQLKNRKNKTINTRDIKSGDSQFRKAYLTESLLFVGKTVVGSEGEGTWAIGATRRYAYRILQNNKMYGQYIG